MRPRSIVGPILLIGIGAFFLFRNIWPEIAVFEMLMRYWPFLLILWGAVRLVEVVFWYATKGSLPAAGVSGGEWTAVVILCLLGSFIFWGSNAVMRWPNNNIRIRGIEIFGERFDFNQSAEKQVSKTPRVVLELGRGNAKIVGADTDKIVVTGRKTIQAYDQADADKGDKETPLEIVSMGEQIVIRTNQDRLAGSRKATSDLEITIPKGASFEGRGRYGDFDIHDLTGNVEIVSDNAGVRAQNIGGTLKVDLRRSDIVRAINVKGAVDVKSRGGQDIEIETIEGPVTVSGSFSGELSYRNLAKPLRFEGTQTEVRVEKVPGMVRLALGNLTAENVQGPIRVNARTRDVQLRDFSGNVDLQVERGDIELRPGKGFGKLDARTKNGEMDLVLPPGSKFDLTATTNRGEVTNDYGAPLKIDSEGKGSSLRGSTGGPAVNLSTDRGAITVRKSGEGGAEPAKSILPKTVGEFPAPPRPPRVPAPVQQ